MDEELKETKAARKKMIVFLCWGRMKNPQLLFDADMRFKKVSGWIPESFSVDLAGSLRTPEEPASYGGQTPAASTERGSSDRKMDGKRTLLLLV